MEPTTRVHYDNLFAQDDDARYAAYLHMMRESEQPVDWVYEVWDEVVANLRHKGNHQRAIAAQLLSNLAKSDNEQRILKEFDKLLAVTRDERFVTARHCLQAIWKVGVAGTEQQQMVIAGLSQRFAECVTEKNCTLIRFDIIQDLWQIYEQVKDERIREKALTLIASEADEKYRKKYAAVWKGRQKS